MVILDEMVRTTIYFRKKNLGGNAGSKRRKHLHMTDCSPVALAGERIARPRSYWCNAPEARNLDELTEYKEIECSNGSLATRSEKNFIFRILTCILKMNVIGSISNYRHIFGVVYIY